MIWPLNIVKEINTKKMDGKGRATYIINTFWKQQQQKDKKEKLTEHEIKQTIKTQVQKRLAVVFLLSSCKDSLMVV